MRIIVERLTAAVKSRYATSGLAVYGAGLGCDCGDCPTPTPDLALPAPRDEHAPTRERAAR